MWTAILCKVFISVLHLQTWFCHRFMILWSATEVADCGWRKTRLQGEQTIRVGPCSTYPRTPPKLLSNTMTLVVPPVGAPRPWILFPRLFRSKIFLTLTLTLTQTLILGPEQAWTKFRTRSPWACLQADTQVSQCDHNYPRFTKLLQ